MNAPGAHETSPEAYYEAILSGSSDFQDLDDESVYRQYLQRAAHSNSRNFIVDFSAQHAWCAFDQSEQTFDALIHSKRPDTLDTRWINIWSPDQQKETVSSLAQYYEFSPRLTGLMCSSPRPKKRKRRQQKLYSENDSHSGLSLKSRKSMLSLKSVKNAKARAAGLNNDPEKAAFDTASSTFRAADHDLLMSLNHYDVVDAMWHWSSVDFGKKYVCLGFNSIYNVDTSKLPGEIMDPQEDLPKGDRVWSWLVLTHDKTVLQITEGLCPDSGFDMENTDASNLRRNVLNVLSQLSLAVDSASRNPISLVPLRHGGVDYGNSGAIDGPGLLFYYLFDDWHTSYSLIAKRDVQYRGELFRLREAMMNEAKLSHINQLDHLGKQLGVLKRLYLSYELIITRVLEKQRVPPTLNVCNHSRPSEKDESTIVATPFGATYDHLGVFLTSGVRVRFERLRDRIRLYALSEIEECLATRESMVMMNFNLMSIRESDAVERLTRITVLLAKVTILFLPVSLMTAYFSTQLDGENGFTVQSYWITFAVIMVLSWVGLWVFGKVSGTVETAMVYKPLNRVIVDIFRRALGREREKEE